MRAVVVCVWCLYVGAEHCLGLGRVKRQEPDAEPEASEDYVADYAGNDNLDPPKESFAAPRVPALSEDRFGDTFADQLRDDRPGDDASVGSAEIHKKKAKKNKYLKKAMEFLKKMLDPNTLLQNAYITETLRKFSDHHEPEYNESEESKEEEVQVQPKVKRKRGRPRKQPTGITGILKKGVMSLANMELDRKKLRKRVRLIKKIARKAKGPLKTVVKIFLSSRNQGIGGYGGGYGGTNY